MFISTEIIRNLEILFPSNSLILITEEAKLKSLILYLKINKQFSNLKELK